MIIMGRKMRAILFFVSLVLCCMGAGIVSAVDVSSPDVATPGDTVSMYLGDVPPGTFVGLTIDGLIKSDTGNQDFFPLSFNVQNLKIPFTLNTPSIELELRNLYPNSDASLMVDPALWGPLTTIIDNQGTGIMSGSSVTSLTSGSYNVRLMGMPPSGKSQIPVKLDITGIVADDITTPRVVSFNTQGFSNGIFNAYLFLNHEPTPVATKAFTIQDSLLAYR